MTSQQCLFYYWRQKCCVNFHSDEVQGRNEASRRALCTNTSKQFICWLLKASCVCSASHTPSHSAAAVYSTRLPSHCLPMFHHKILFQKWVVTLKTKYDAGFSLERRQRWVVFSVSGPENDFSPMCICYVILVINALCRVLLFKLLSRMHPLPCLTGLCFPFKCVMDKWKRWECSPCCNIWWWRG